MKKLLLSLIVMASIAKQVKAQIITTVCGNGTAGYSGDGGQATNAELYYPTGVAFDAAHNLHIVDFYNNRIRKITTTGIITTVAGTGTAGFSGDGGQATAAELNNPTAISFDASGNLYIADRINYRIRKVNSLGIITTVAGGVTQGYSGDGGPATAAELNSPVVITFDASGNLYMGDNSCIRKVNTNGIITTIAGNGGALGQGYSGDGGPATDAKLDDPFGLAFDAVGNLYIADYSKYCIRKVNTVGIITTFAGTGTGGYSGDGGIATNAELYYPAGLAFDAAGNLYIADDANNRVRKINTAGIITTIVGDGTLGFSGDGAAATAAEINSPWDICFDAAGNLYMADEGNMRIRMVTNVGQSAGIETLKNNKEQVNIYPNPATNSLQVSFAGTSEGSTLVMCDMLGNTVKQMPFNTQHCTISVADLEAGVYFITLTSGASISTQKVIVSK